MQWKENSCLSRERKKRDKIKKGPKEKWLHLVTTEGARRGRVKSEEDLAGISTEGARDNSNILKNSLVDAHHKDFNYKNPK